jgi:hypothetical protein
LNCLAGVDLDKNFADPVSAGLNELLGVKIVCDARQVLGRSWSQVLIYIVRANTYRKRAPATWLRSINCINEIFVRAFVKIHNNKVTNIDSKIVLKGKKNKPTKYGIIIASDQRLTKFYPGHFDELVEINNRRNSDQESHPIDQRTGRRAKHVIKQREIDGLSRLAATAIRKIDSLIVAARVVGVGKDRV